MSKLLKKVRIVSLVLVFVLALAAPAYAAESGAAEPAAAEQTQGEDSVTNWKAMASAVAIGLAALGGTLGMGIATGKAAESVSRQPEAEGKVRTTLMLGLVFIETAIIYALLVVILVIFVL